MFHNKFGILSARCLFRGITVNMDIKGVELSGNRLQGCTDQVIGDIWVYLIENDRMASVAVRLSSEYQGNGYGTEALSAMTKFCFANCNNKLDTPW